MQQVMSLLLTILEIACILACIEGLIRLCKNRKDKANSPKNRASPNTPLLALPREEACSLLKEQGVMPDLIRRS